MGQCIDVQPMDICMYSHPRHSPNWTNLDESPIGLISVLHVFTLVFFTVSWGWNWHRRSPSQWWSLLFFVRCFCMMLHKSAHLMLLRLCHAKLKDANCFWATFCHPPIRLEVWDCMQSSNSISACQKPTCVFCCAPEHLYSKCIMVSWPSFQARQKPWSL